MPKDYRRLLSLNFEDKIRPLAYALGSATGVALGFAYGASFNELYLSVGIGFITLAIVVVNEVQHKKTHLRRAPGSRLAVIAEGLLTKKFYKKIIEPIISDFQFEYFEAIQEGRIWRARWMRVVYTFMFLATLILQIPVWTARTFVALWKVGTGS